MNRDNATAPAGRHAAHRQGPGRAPTMNRGTHRAPTFGKGSHRAPVELAVGQTATAAVFGVAAAAVALSSASAAAGPNTSDDNTQNLDTGGMDAVAANQHTDPQVQAALAGRANAPASRGATKAVAVQTSTKRTVKPAIKPIRAKRAVVPKGMAYPMPGAQVTSCFGQRWGVLHAGIDFARPSGTPIHAVKDGIIVGAGWNYSGYGISVMVKHSDGYLTHYAHMSRKAVHAGQRVKAGQLLGYEGSTGDSTGPHLHFEVHKGMWNQVNPAPWLRARGLHVGC